MRNSLTSKLAGDIYVYMFFVLVATGFWMIKTLQETYETEVAIPLVLTDVPEGVVITRPLPDTVYVKVRDRGTTLFGIHFHSDDRPMTVSFREQKTVSAISTIVLPDVQKRIASMLPEGTSVLSVRPDTLSFSYNRGIFRRVPVYLAGNLSTTPQYYLHDVVLTPDSVTVYATQQELDKLDSVGIEVTGCDNLQSSCHVTVQLPESRTMTYMPDTIGVQANVDVYTEKTVRVPVTGLNFPPDKRLRTFPAMVDITFRVGSSYYNSVVAEDFVLAVPYEDLAGSSNTRWHVSLRALPPNASFPRFNPADVEFLIEHVASNH